MQPLPCLSIPHIFTKQGIVSTNHCVVLSECTIQQGTKYSCRTSRESVLSPRRSAGFSEPSPAALAATAAMTAAALAEATAAAAAAARRAEGLKVKARGGGQAAATAAAVVAYPGASAEWPMGDPRGWEKWKIGQVVALGECSQHCS